MKIFKNILCFSDTHGKHDLVNIPENIDRAIFAGDAGTVRNPHMNQKGILDFIEWYSSLPNIKYKIWIAGNHCTSIEAKLVDAKLLSKEKGLIYLEHESIEIEGLKIFGSPYTPSFSDGWAFNIPRNNLRNYWRDIPKDTDILITHGPPFGIGDFVPYNWGEFVGDEELLTVVSKELSNLKLHVFGHIHYSYGVINKNDAIFVNASVVNEGYIVVNKPIIIKIKNETNNQK